mmetsp:Transcript_11014/g.26484  ORF Transcript_11014/g.26484 Transcript_11014/m.26484 type:complete len:432 (-) Transcript_11014:119-1414(-)
MAEETSPKQANTSSQAAPENRDAWMAKYEANLARAKFLTSDVQRKLRVNEASDAMNKEMKESGQKREKEQLKRKVRGRVREHTEVINEAQRSIKDIEDAITQVEGCQTRLVHMRYARFADLKVCEKRLELRKRRPGPENFRDAVEEALERERGVLERARQDLLALEAEAHQFLTDLQAMRAELSRDTGARRLQVESELAHMRRATGASVSLPEVDKKNNQTHQVIKLLTEEEAKSLKQRSIDVIRKAKELPDKVDVTVGRVRQESEQCTRRSARQLGMKTRELGEFKKTLEESIRAVDGTLTQAKLALSKEEGRLETVMGEKALQQTQERVNDLTAMVQELQDSHRGLVEELRCKVGALDIDNSCRRVTPQVAAEPSKKLQQSASAPTLRKADAIEDNSPDAHPAPQSPQSAANGTYLPPIAPKSPAIAQS